MTIKKTGYKEGAELSPIDQIAEMVTEHPDVISESRPNATWMVGDHNVIGIAFRDEQWEQAMHEISEAWTAGYKIMIFDDGLLMTNDTEVLNSAQESQYNIVYPRTVTDALAYARHYWWTLGDERAVNHGSGEEQQAPVAVSASEPVGDQFPRLEDIEKIANLTEDFGMGMEAPVMDAPSQTSARSVEQLEAELDALLAAEMGPTTEPITEPEAPVAPMEPPSAPSQPDPFTPTRPAVTPDPKACGY